MTPEDETLIAFIDAADDSGLLHLDVPANRIYSELPSSKLDAARELLELVFSHQSLLTLKLDRVKRHARDVLEHFERRPDGSCRLVVRLAPLMLLPGVAPREELAQLRELLVAMRDEMSARGTVRCDVQLCNNRDHSKRVYGSLAFRTLPEGTAKALHDEAATLSLNARIETSDVLRHWLREVALGLQKLGPWSWCCIQEDHLFGSFEGPWFKHFRELRAATQGT